MPPVTPSRTRRRSNGRIGYPGETWMASRAMLMAAARRHSCQKWHARILLRAKRRCSHANLGMGPPAPAINIARLLSAAARHDAVDDATRRQLLHRARRQFLLARRRAIARELVEHARMLRGDEDAEI